MASSSKKRTTFAKLNREAAVRDRRQIKQAKRAARKLEDGAVEDQHVVEDTSHLDVAHVEGVIDGLESKPHRR
ncbi:hypothetical protein [Solirubrobacter soli]|uniref:hypothetical protein n=1 Tax=Solirubrobacter soli TaxID=363832 RepID=UPI000403C481|nr:hypothetical protein [Solirubrobacter soli]